MRQLIDRLVFFLLGVSLLLAAPYAWTAGGEKATPLEAVADTRDLEPGFTKFIADTYNTNLWLFALYAVVIMAAMGLVLGVAVDKLMSLTGINLGKMEHDE